MEAGLALAVIQTLVDSENPKLSNGAFGSRLAERLGVKAYSDGEMSAFTTGQRDFPAALLVAAFDMIDLSLPALARVRTTPPL